MLWWTRGCRYFFETVILFPSDIYPEVEFLDHVLVLFLIFWGPSILFSIVAAPIYIPTNSTQGCWWEFNSHPNRREVISLWFWFTFPRWLVMLSTFSWTCSRLYIFFGEMSVQFLCSFFNQIVFCHLSCVSLYIFWMLTFYQIHGLQIFLQVAYSLLVSVQKLLSLMYPTCLFLHLLFCAFGITSKKLSPRPV